MQLKCAISRCGPAIAIVVLVVATTLHGCRETDEAAITVGSKSFTESVVLAEILARLIEAEGLAAEHQRLGGTPVVWNALLGGEIDCYVEYTGTLRQEILQRQTIGDLKSLRDALAERRIGMSDPLGFNNTYALGVSADFRRRHPDVTTISQLAEIDGVRYGFGNEFMQRRDGWPSLRREYGLPAEAARGLDHDLAYRGIESGSLDVIDLYSTDAEIELYDIRVLEDDRQFFPKYEAVVLYRQELAERYPDVLISLLRLEGQIDAETMVEMNAAAKLNRIPEPVVSAAFVEEEFGIESVVEVRQRRDRLWQMTWQHLWLVGVSMTAAIFIAIPLGIAAAKFDRLGQAVLGGVGILQTVPSLALFVLFIPLLGVGVWPAVAALFLYSLLPIVRNTHAGLVGIPSHLQESSIALGLTPFARLRLVELPLAMPSILAGIKTATVINIGTATLGGFISAGGYGEAIFTGIRLARTDLLLEGAIPAALMALAAQVFFDFSERRIVPRGMIAR